MESFLNKGSFLQRSRMVILLDRMHVLPGRIRFPCPTLQGNKGLARELEKKLIQTTGVTSVDANEHTGKILVHFLPPQLSWQEIVQRANEIRCQYRPGEVKPASRESGPYFPTIAGLGLLLGLSLRRLVGWASPWKNSITLAHTAGLITVVTGFPHLRRKAAHLGPKSGEILLTAAAISTLAVRESFLGVTALTLVSLNTFLAAQRQEQSRRILRHFGSQTAPAPQIDPYDGRTQPLWPLSVSSSLILAASGRPGQALQALVVTCPCAYQLNHGRIAAYVQETNRTRGIYLHSSTVYLRLTQAKALVCPSSWNAERLQNELTRQKLPLKVYRGDNKTVKSLQNEGLNVAYVGSDPQALRQCHTAILTSTSPRPLPTVDVVIPEAVETQVVHLFSTAFRVREKNRINQLVIKAGQTAALAVVFAGGLNIFSALSFHHMLNIGILAGSLFVDVPHRISKRQVVAKPRPRSQNFPKLARTDLHLGLTTEEARRRLRHFGPNRLPDPKRISLLNRLAAQCRGTMALIMVGSTSASLVAGGIEDTIALGGLFATNTLVNAVQSGQADQAVSKLHQLNKGKCQVMRDGKVQEVSTEEIVPGDLVLLGPGITIPADGYLVTLGDVTVDESMLTGESREVLKSHLIQFPPELAAGTRLVRGNGNLLAVRTGVNTRMGKIALMLRQDASGPTPLQVNLDQLGKQLLKGIIVIVGSIVVIGWLRGNSLAQMGVTGASLAAASIPQGLPTFVTLGLAAGVRELAKRKAVVRRLSALETMACVNCLCLDKTGTITQNQMTVTELVTSRRKFALRDGKYTLDDNPVKVAAYEDLYALLEAAVICSDTSLADVPNAKTEFNGDSTEGAILLAAEVAGLKTKEIKRQTEILAKESFSSEKERMSVAAEYNGRRYLWTKGSPESVLRLCSLSSEKRQEYLDQAQTLASKGLRVLAAARQRIDGESPQPLEFLGLIGMIDPPRPKVASVIQRCREAGIHVVMITGDHPQTAQRIGYEVGLADSSGQTMSGDELTNLLAGGKEALARLREITVFSRVAPEQKRAIVNALQEQGFVVAMVGDGINDGPALRAADVGISMGAGGTEVAQEASDIVLSNSDLEQVISAIEQGRTAYDNISKVVSYLLTSNAGEIALMLGASAAGIGMPLLPIQLLWVNLLGDGPPALALCLERSTSPRWKEPPRQRDRTLLDESLKRRILLRGARMGLTTLVFYLISIRQGLPLSRARTRAFAALSVEQVLHLFETRIVQPNQPVPDNPTARRTALLSIGMLVASIYFSPLQKLFRLVPLQLAEWLLVLAVSFIASPLRLPSRPRPKK